MQSYFHILHRTLEKISDKKTGKKNNTFYIDPKIVSHVESLPLKFEKTRLGSYYKEVLEKEKNTVSTYKILNALETAFLKKFKTLSEKERIEWSQELVTFYTDMLIPFVGVEIGKTKKKRVFANKSIVVSENGQVQLYLNAPSTAKAVLFNFNLSDSAFSFRKNRHHFDFESFRSSSSSFLTHVLSGYHFLDDKVFLDWLQGIKSQIRFEIEKKEKSFFHSTISPLISLKEYKLFKEIFMLKGENVGQISVSLWNDFVANKEKILQLYSEDPVRFPKAIKMMSFLDSNQSLKFSDNYMKEVRDFLKGYGLSNVGWKKGFPQLPNAVLKKGNSYKLELLSTLFPLMDGNTDLSLVYNFFQKEENRRKLEIVSNTLSKFNIPFEQNVKNSAEALEFAKEYDAFSERIGKIRKLVLENIDVKDGGRFAEELFDFLSGAGNGVWQSLPPSSQLTWEGLQRRQRDWHEIVQTQEMQERSAQVWESVLNEPVSNEDFTATPLTDGGMLFKEGKEMHHCVASYSSRCMKGGTRLFKVTSKEGDSIGTLEIVDSRGDWSVTQFRGYCNQGITDIKALEFANTIAQQYTIEHKKQIALLEKAKAITVKADAIEKPLVSKKTVEMA